MVMDGTCRYIINGSSVEVRAGEVILINSGAIHSIYPEYSSFSRESLAYSLIFSYEAVKMALPDMDEYYFDNAMISRNPDVTAAFTKMCEICEKKEEFWKPEALGSMYHLLYVLCDSGARKQLSCIPINSQKSVERIRGILIYIGEHYTEKITEQDVAERFYFSRVYFARFFKKYTGMTFLEYLTRYRSENALYEELKFDIDDLYLLGDAHKVSNIMYAIWDAFEVANHI